MRIKCEILARAYRIIEAAHKVCTKDEGYRLEEIEIHAEGFAEPGYNSESGVVATGNWNSESKYENGKSEEVSRTLPRVADLFEKLGIDLEWSDEWTTCGNCQKLVRTTSDSHGWKRAYVVLDGDIACLECVMADVSSTTEYLESMEGNASDCVTLDINPAEYGYKLLEEKLQNGLHEGMAANPKLIGQALLALGVKRYLFVLDESSQFYIEFSVWVADEEYEKIDMEKWAEAKKEDDITPAQHCRDALAKATIQQAAIKGEGVVVTKCDVSTGEATTRLVSPQDFIDGKALD